MGKFPDKQRGVDMGRNEVVGNRAIFSPNLSFAIFITAISVVIVLTSSDGCKSAFSNVKESVKAASGLSEALDGK